jgi:peptidoglycan/xylan/chitin deacetylase (PgdA/CDA1 family)
MTASIKLSNAHDYYGAKLIGLFLLMILGLAYASFYLTQNYISNSFLMGTGNNEKIYFLKSTTLANMYEHNGMDYEGYEKRVHYLEGIAKERGYSVVEIDTDALQGLKKSAIVVGLDMMSLSSSEIATISNFVKNGGKILFNFTAGFLDPNLHYQADNLVSSLTPLVLDPQTNTISYDKKSTGYLSLRLMSPFSNELIKGKAHEVFIYDRLPLFITPKNLEADAYLTNWSQTNYMTLPTRELHKNESGLIWHGNVEKGKWVYFSFPSYVFMDANRAAYKKLFESMLDYLQNDVTVLPYPYIDTKSVVFVSEDTEYKFANLEHFSDIAQKNNFPVTAFCVAQLAEKNENVMKKVATNPYLEIGSHSYTHKQIVGMSDDVYEKETGGSKKLLEELTGKNVIGFRPPREEIDKKLITNLEDAGYKYILNKGEDRLSTYFKESLLIIPRHGTDDYSYLVNLDWNSERVLAEIEHQVQVLKAFNGIFTLSVHTHLMSYGTNIKIEDKFFQYVNSQVDLHPMNGKMIYKRLAAMRDFSYSYKITQKKVIITLSNSADEPLKDLHFEIEVAPGIKLVDIDSEIIGFKTELIHEKDNRYTVVVKQLEPRSELMLFVNYEKI